jgi:hypothetical protein
MRSMLIKDSKFHRPKFQLKLRANFHEISPEISLPKSMKLRNP